MPEMMEAPASYAVRTLFNEETTVEREIIEHLKASKLGWTWRSRAQLIAHRPDEREVLLLPLLREKLKALNPAVLIDEARVDAIITKLRGCRDNQQWLAWLKSGVNYKFDAAENAQDVRLIDFENLDANDWWVTNQFPVEGHSPRRPDIVLLINGIREHFRKTFQQVWDLFPEATVPRDGSHDAFIAAMKILRDVDVAEKQFDTGYRNLRVLYEALQPDEQLRDFVRPYAWLTKLYMLYRKKFYPDASKSIEATEEDAARTRELIREHIDVDALETEFPTYVLDEHFLTKLKDKNPDAKALDIEAMLSAELRIRMDQDENFRSLSEKLQRLIDEKRAGTLAGIVLIEELEKLTEAVRAAVDEANRPIAQQLALKVKARNAAISETLAAEIAAATLVEADKHCFPGWWSSSTVDPELSRGLLFMVATQFSSSGLLADDAMGFIGTLVQTLKRKHYKPQPEEPRSDDTGG